MVGKQGVGYKLSRVALGTRMSFGSIKEHALWGPNSQKFGYSGAEFPRAYARIPQPVSTGVENGDEVWTLDPIRPDRNSQSDGKVSKSRCINLFWFHQQQLE